MDSGRTTALQHEWRLRDLTSDELLQADELIKLGFVSFLGPAAETAFRNKSYSTRWFAAAKSVVAEDNGQLIGIAFMTRWGDIGNFGPIVVHPDYWGRGVAQALLAGSFDALEGCSMVKIFTNPSSFMHHHLYMKFGLYPQFLAYITQLNIESVERDQQLDHTEAFEMRYFGRLDDTNKLEAREDIKAIFCEAVEGLDPNPEVAAVQQQNLGETLLMYDSATQQIAAAAIIHSGAGSEAGSGRCFIKFAVACDEQALKVLLTRVTTFAAELHCTDIEVGVDLLNKRAFQLVAQAGFKVQRPGVCMVRTAAHRGEEKDSLLLTDWR